MGAPAFLLLVSYAWLTSHDPAQSVERRFPPPPGFEREAALPGSFAEWLRGLPLKAGRPPVRLFDGRLKANQDVHAAVVDIDVGGRDLQQCADAVIRLRAEYLFASGRASDVAFKYTSGDRVDFARWSSGERPVVQGSRVRWERKAPPDASHASFRRYLDAIFTYAGSQSLAGELAPAGTAAVKIGDVFIQGGSPGHAVIVVDVVRQSRTGRSAFLLAQSYMPAQEVHVLRHPSRDRPWYEIEEAAALVTPEWTFPSGSHRRFAGENQ